MQNATVVRLVIDYINFHSQMKKATAILHLNSLLLVYNTQTHNRMVFISMATIKGPMNVDLELWHV